MGAAQPVNGNGDVKPGSAPYVLDGTLPDGQPADRPVWRVGDADRHAASRVARALHLDETPTRIDGGWVLRSGGDNRLLVRDDGSWSYGMDCFADQPVSDEKPGVMCASAAGGVAVAAPPPEPVDPPQRAPTFIAGPSAADARADAAPILDALGLADARMT